MKQTLKMPTELIFFLVKKSEYYFVDKIAVMRRKDFTYTLEDAIKINGFAGFLFHTDWTENIKYEILSKKEYIEDKSFQPLCRTEIHTEFGNFNFVICLEHIHDMRCYNGLISGESTSFDLDYLDLYQEIVNVICQTKSKLI